MSIETRSIDYIPENERHGAPRSLFYIWFGANANITTIAAGVLPVSLGLNLFWSSLAIIIGSLIGAIFMASHSAQGPTLGIPQMIQSRAQFGAIGAILPLSFVMVIYLGFFVSNTLLAAQSLAAVGGVSQTFVIYMLGIACFIVALYGYVLIHKVQKYLTIASIIVFAAVTVVAFRLPLDHAQWAISNFSLSKFLMSVSIAVTWQLSYAPYVADYSRYLPTKTDARSVFWNSYFGTVIGGSWLMILGAILTAGIHTFSADVGSGLATIFGVGVPLMLVFVVIGQVAINVFNLYGAFMSTVAVIEPFLKLKVTPVVRGTFMLVICVIATVLCTATKGDFINFFLNFIFFMSYFLIPWTAINLVDFYFVRKGVYEINEIFKIDGEYGKINLCACIAFISAIALQIPFVNTTIYEGPISKMLGGIDFAWVVGLLVPAAFYYSTMTKITEKRAAAVKL
jgi:nucleobase:cation symporter-1, NCS1 family